MSAARAGIRPVIELRRVTKTYGTGETVVHAVAGVDLVVHRGDYVVRHHLDVERDPASCKKCHGSQFCDSCHQAQQLSPRSLNPRDPHPPGWVQRGSGNFHGEAARNNIVSCSGCHDQGAASICVACHQVGGVGGNPHPAGWTRKHDRGDIPKNVACRACHSR